MCAYWTGRDGYRTEEDRQQDSANSDWEVADGYRQRSRSGHCERTRRITVQQTLWRFTTTVMMFVTLELSRVVLGVVLGVLLGFVLRRIDSGKDSPLIGTEDQLRRASLERQHKAGRQRAR
jgi:hypothetical protein